MDIRALFRRKQWHVVERASEDHTYVCRRHGPFRHRAIAEQLARDVAAKWQNIDVRIEEWNP